MSYSLIWLPKILKDADLKVATEFGWENRGRGDMGTILGVICHHTANPNNGNMPALRSLIDGRPDLPGPLAQLGLGRDGTYYVVAAGRCNHAGEGDWMGITTGNTNFIGIEAENKGSANDPWPDVQIEAYHRGVAAILKYIRRGTEFCVGHKEWARNRTDPAKKKVDPDFNMNVFRSNVAAILNGIAPPPELVPAVEPVGPNSSSPGRPTLRRGATGEWVIPIQQKVGVETDGYFGAKTEAAVRAFQRIHGFVPDGIVGPKTWKAIDSIV